MTTTGLTCCVTFDFDAMSVWLGSYKSRNPSMISRGEFGAVAVPRILELLKRLDISSSFCVPGHTALAYPDIVKQIADHGHEIAHHGWVHENPANFDIEGEKANIERGLEALHKAAGIRPKGYRSPSWDFSDNTIDVLLEYGFSYDSSLMGDDFSPYYLRRGDRAPLDAPYEFGHNVDLVELPVTWGLDDFPHFEFVDGDTYGLSAPSKVEEIWRDEFEYARAHIPGGIFNLTTHPQVIGRGHRLMMLERLIRSFQEFGDVTFDTLGNYTEKWRAANPLPKWVASGNVHANPGARVASLAGDA